jgi:hypothetical protein
MNARAQPPASRRVRHTLLIAGALLVIAGTMRCHAADIETANGRVFKDVEIKRVDEYGLIIKYEERRFARLWVEDLPDDVRERYFGGHGGKAVRPPPGRAQKQTPANSPTEAGLPKKANRKQASEPAPSAGDTQSELERRFAAARAKLAAAAAKQAEKEKYGPNTVPFH